MEEGELKKYLDAEIEQMEKYIALSELPREKAACEWVHKYAKKFREDWDA